LYAPFYLCTSDQNFGVTIAFLNQPLECVLHVLERDFFRNQRTHVEFAARDQINRAAKVEAISPIAGEQIQFVAEHAIGLQLEATILIDRDQHQSPLLAGETLRRGKGIWTSRRFEDNVGAARVGQLHDRIGNRPATEFLREVVAEYLDETNDFIPVALAHDLRHQREQGASRHEAVRFVRDRMLSDDSVQALLRYSDSFGLTAEAIVESVNAATATAMLR
jgi:predicted DNA-binding protein